MPEYTKTATFQPMQWTFVFTPGQCGGVLTLFANNEESQINKQVIEASHKEDSLLDCKEVNE